MEAVRTLQLPFHLSHYLLDRPASVVSSRRSHLTSTAIFLFQSLTEALQVEDDCTMVVVRSRDVCCDPFLLVVKR